MGCKQWTLNDASVAGRVRGVAGSYVVVRSKVAVSDGKRG